MIKSFQESKKKKDDNAYLTFHKLGQSPCFFRLTSLDELDCSFNEIEALPSSIGQCVNIRTFAADHNFLTQLPPEVSACSSLVYI